MEPEETWHPRMKNLVYYGMDWLCASCLVTRVPLICFWWGRQQQGTLWFESLIWHG